MDKINISNYKAEMRKETEAPRLIMLRMGVINDALLGMQPWIDYL